MGKSCGASQCCGPQNPSSPSPPRSNKASGSRKMDTASVDTIDTAPGSKFPLKGPSTSCAPSCHAVSPNKTQSSKSCSPNTSDFSKEFMNSLVGFMEESYAFVKNWKDTIGHGQKYSMSDTERMERIQELLTLIAQKEAELSALEAQRDALGSSTSGSSPGRSQLSSYYQNAGSAGTQSSCNVSCQATCSPSSTIHTSDLVSAYSDVNTADILSPYPSPISPIPQYPRTPANSGYDYLPEMERSMHDYTCEDECQAQCTDSNGDMLNNAFIDSGCDPNCTDSSGDILNTGFVDYGGYSPMKPQQYVVQQQYSPPPQQYSPQQYAPPQYTPQQYTQSYTQAARSNVPTRSNMAGRSVSSCYCPSDAAMARYNRKR